MNIDWTQLETAETRKAARRAGVSLSRSQFAIAAKRAKLVTPKEAKDWAAGNALPAIAAQALQALPTQDERDDAEIVFLAAATINRADPMVALMQNTLGLTDTQVDALFGI